MVDCKRVGVAGNGEFFEIEAKKFQEHFSDFSVTEHTEVIDPVGADLIYMGINDDSWFGGHSGLSFFKGCEDGWERGV